MIEDAGLRLFILLLWAEDIYFREGHVDEEGRLFSLLWILVWGILAAQKDKIGVLKQGCDNFHTWLNYVFQGQGAHGCPIVRSQQTMVEEVQPATVQILQPLAKVRIVLIDADHLRGVDEYEKTARVEKAVVRVVRLYVLKYEALSAWAYCLRGDIQFDKF